MHLAAGFAIAVQVLERTLGVAILPGVDAGLLRSLKQLQHALRRMPGRLMLAEELVEMGIAVDRIAADDQPRDGVRAELNGRQQRGR